MNPGEKPSPKTLEYGPNFNRNDYLAGDGAWPLAVATLASNGLLLVSMAIGCWFPVECQEWRAAKMHARFLRLQCGLCLRGTAMGSCDQKD